MKITNYNTLEENEEVFAGFEKFKSSKKPKTTEFLQDSKKFGKPQKIKKF